MALGTEKLRIGELAERANVTKRTIDYYTNLGLLEAERSASNYRYYDHTSIERLRFIELKKSEGMSLEEIKAKLQERDQTEIDIHQLQETLSGIKKEVSEILAQLDQTKEEDWESLKKELPPESLSLIEALFFYRREQ